MRKINLSGETATSAVTALPWERPILPTAYSLFNYQGKIVIAQNFNYYRERG